DVERVRYEEQENDEVEQRSREMIADVRRQAVPGDAPDARADDLDADHQRRGEYHRPQQPVAELRAGLRVRGDAARIVVGGAGDEAGPEPLQERHAAAVVLFLHFRVAFHPGDGMRGPLTAA